MIGTSLEELQGVVIVQAVQDLVAIHAGLREAHLPQLAELVKDGRLAEPRSLVARPDAHLCMRQGSDDSNATRSAKFQTAPPCGLPPRLRVTILLGSIRPQWLLSAPHSPPLPLPVDR